MMFRRSIYVVKDITAGEILTVENIRSIRPGFGLAPKNYKELLGKVAKIDIKCGSAMKWNFIK